MLIYIFLSQTSTSKISAAQGKREQPELVSEKTIAHARDQKNKQNRNRATAEGLCRSQGRGDFDYALWGPQRRRAST
jgi:hypothetical protein